MEQGKDLNLTEIFETVIDNSESIEDLKGLRDFLTNPFSEEDIVDIDDLVNNYSVEELREMGFEI